MTIVNDQMEKHHTFSIDAGELKTKCLQLLDDIAKNRTPLVITTHGKPVAQLVPMPPEKSLFGAMAGSAHYESDIVSPIEVAWDAAM